MASQTPRSCLAAVALAAMCGLGCGHLEPARIECLGAADSVGDRALGFELGHQDDDRSSYRAAPLAGDLRSRFIRHSARWEYARFEPEWYPWAYGADHLWGLDWAASLDAGALLELRIVHGPSSAGPAWLAGYPFDDPRVIDDLEEVVGVLFDDERGHWDTSPLRWLVIGQELDRYHAGDVEEFIPLLQRIRAVTRANGVPLYAMGSVRAILAEPAAWGAVARQVDGIMGVYHGVDEGFWAEDPEMIRHHIGDLTYRFPDTRFVLDVGYPSSLAAGSSEVQQAEFYCEFFAAWDRHSNSVGRALIHRVTDVGSRSEAVHGAVHSRGLDPSPLVNEVVRSMGLHDHRGAIKPAGRTFRDELERRGW